MIGYYGGTSCTVGTCINGGYYGGFAEDSHWHYFTDDTGYENNHTHPNIDTGGGTDHRHLLNNTGAQPSPGHRHLISSDALYNHYVYNVGLTLDLVTSVKESPYHAHTGGNIVDHGHVVPSDGRVLLKNTNVTITYMAQEED
jgi:hypothetical protein